jgi:uncharacterized protein
MRSGALRQVVLGKTGLSVSAVGFGGIPIQRVSEAEAAAAIHRALDLGVNFFDSAAGYSDSQKKIGAALTSRRERVVLASKSGDRTRDGILRDIDRARAEFGVDRIDIYQLHAVNTPDDYARCRAPGGAVEGLVEARTRGWIAHAGVTSHSIDLSMEMIDNPLFETIQFPFNLVTAEPKDDLIPKARRLNLGFIVMKPLCGGQYDDAGLAFKFLNAYPDLVPIPGIETPAEIEEIVRIVLSGETLKGDDRRRANAIVRRLGKRFCRRCGYCQPCPRGIPITLAMIFDSFARRFPVEGVRAGLAATLNEKIPTCTGCGECEKKCPYELPIRKELARTLAKVRALLGGAGPRE